MLCSYKDLLSWVARRCAPRRWHTRGRRGADLFIAFAARNAVTFLVVAKSSSLAQSQCNLPSHTGSALRVTKTLTEILMWSACHKKSYLTNLEVRNLKSEISCLCPVWLSQFCLFWKKMGKGFVNIPKFVNSTHNKYLFLWHADHISQENKEKEVTFSLLV